MNRKRLPNQEKKAESTLDTINRDIARAQALSKKDKFNKALKGKKLN